jgi:hypothetical protein
MTERGLVHRRRVYGLASLNHHQCTLYTSQSVIWRLLIHHHSALARMDALFFSCSLRLSKHADRRILRFTCEVNSPTSIFFLINRFLCVQYSNFRNCLCSCAERNSRFDACVNGTAISIPPDAILAASGGTGFPLWANTLLLLAFLLVFRFLGYLVLRYFRRPR